MDRTLKKPDRWDMVPALVPDQEVGAEPANPAETKPEAVVVEPARTMR